jgi:hypothetical protein
MTLGNAAEARVRFIVWCLYCGRQVEPDPAEMAERYGAEMTVPVRETFDGNPVWEGVVHVFDLACHPTATRAYAWSSPIEGSTKRRFFAALHTDRINSPLKAVRAAIVAGHRK